MNKELVAKINEITNKRQEDGNYFSYLGLSNKEKIHSAFLANLLNQNGSHRMGTFFLKSFLAHIYGEEYIENLPFCYSSVYTEQFLGQKTNEEGGYLDIVIYIGSKVFIIENKIYAEDQENQLFRYSNYINKYFPTSEEKGIKHLIYLTLTGKNPSLLSTRINIKETPDKKYWKNISYKTDILPWLKCVIEDKQVSCMSIKNDIEKYCENIEDLVEKETMNDEEKDIVNSYSLKDLNNMKDTLEEIISKYQREILENGFKEFIETCLKEVFDSVLFLENESDIDDDSKGYIFEISKNQLPSVCIYLGFQPFPLYCWLGVGDKNTYKKWYYLNTKHPEWDAYIPFDNGKNAEIFSKKLLDDENARQQREGIKIQLKNGLQSLFEDCGYKGYFD
ncbi:MAG: PD-(D/E)XK nuclease family protein [Treponema sp.]|nr:PD-(D/E)XK nuclease family protein [Treponema sp.]